MKLKEVNTQALVSSHEGLCILSLLISAADEVEFVSFRTADPALISSRLNCSFSLLKFTVFWFGSVPWSPVLIAHGLSAHPVPDVHDAVVV